MKFGKSLVMGIALGALPWWAAAAAPAAQTFTDAFVPVDYGLMNLQVRGPQPACGFVSVPLRHGEAASPRIRLAWHQAAQFRQSTRINQGRRL